MRKLPDILPIPEKPLHLSDTAKWLSGEGAGSWFVINSGNQFNKYHIQRFSPDGKFECEGMFMPDSQCNLDLEYKITYPSHCQKVTIVQDNICITMINCAGKIS